MRRFAYFLSLKSAPYSYQMLHSQVHWPSPILSDTNAILRASKRVSLGIDNIQNHKISTDVKPVHPVGIPFLDSEAQGDDLFSVNDLILPLSTFEEVLHRKTFTFSGE